MFVPYLVFQTPDENVYNELKVKLAEVLSKKFLGE